MKDTETQEAESANGSAFCNLFAYVLFSWKKKQKKYRFTGI
jgi:hypothetical protein